MLRVAFSLGVVNLWVHSHLQLSGCILSRPKPAPNISPWLPGDAGLWAEAALMFLLQEGLTSGRFWLEA